MGRGCPCIHQTPSPASSAGACLTTVTMVRCSDTTEVLGDAEQILKHVRSVECILPARTSIPSHGYSVVAQFAYSDAWYPATDGQDRSLVLVNPSQVSPGQLGQKSEWRASYRWGGSPGSPDVP